MCDCIKQANKQLKANNTAIATKMQINFTTGKMTEVMVVPTEKVNSRGAKAKIVPINYCPLCGEKQR